MVFGMKGRAPIIGECELPENQQRLDAYRKEMRRTRGQNISANTVDRLVRMYSINRIHAAVKKAIEKKLISKGVCELCGESKVEGHHDDYNFPLSVRWLCIPHHKEWHRVNKPVQLRADCYVLSMPDYLELGLKNIKPPIAKLIRSLKPPKPRKVKP